MYVYLQKSMGKDNHNLIGFCLKVHKGNIVISGIINSGITIVQIPDNVIQYRFLLQKYSCYTQSDHHSSFSPAPLIKHCGPDSDSPPAAGGQRELRFCYFPVQKPVEKNMKTVVRVLF